MDVAGLKKVHIIDRATTRNGDKIKPGRRSYACMLNDDGKFVDDCVIYRTGPDIYMVVSRSEQGQEQLTMAATGRDVDIRFDDILHDISLQGPMAVDLLEDAGVPGSRDQAQMDVTIVEEKGCHVHLAWSPNPQYSQQKRP